MYRDTDWNYAHTRLTGTIVRHGDTPVVVHEVERAGAMVTTLGRSDPHRVRLSELNVVPVSLGFVNYEGTASYVCRVPKRRDWRQGARNNNLTSFGLPPQALSPAAMSKTIRNNYPTFETCLRKTREQGGSWAWHRHWAIDSGSRLMYKSQGAVGSIVNGRPVLDDKFIHLQEYLEECL